LRDRLFQEAGCAERESQFRLVPHRADDHRYVTGVRVGLEQLEQFPPVYGGHHHIQRDDAGLELAGQRQHLCRVLDADDLDVRTAQIAPEHLDGRGLIVNYHHDRLCGTGQGERQTGQAGRLIRRAERCVEASHPVADGLERGLLCLLSSPRGRCRRPGLKLDPEHRLRGLHLDPEGNFIPGAYLQRIIQHAEKHLAEHNAVGQNAQRFLWNEQGQPDARALRPPLERSGYTL